MEPPANTFSSFYINKISTRSSLPSDSCLRVLNHPDTRKVLQNLTCVTNDEVCRLVLLAPCKSSDLDPIPTSFVKDCIDILLTPITSIIDLLLSGGSFPSHFKSALVSPRLKWPSLNNIKYCRPVSNVSFPCKVLEKVVVNHLNSPINSSNKYNHYQSTYRKFHSTETALLKSTVICCRQWMLATSQHWLCLTILLPSIPLTIWPLTKSPLCARSFPLLRSFHWLPAKFRTVFKISLLTYKIIPEKQPVYFHSMLAPSLPSRSWRSNKRIILSVYLGSSPTQAQEHFSLASLFFGTTCRCLVSCNVHKASQDTSLWHQHAQWPVDFTELLHRFCCWTLIRLLRHWAWLRWGYWHYRNVIDWLIKIFQSQTTVCITWYMPYGSNGSGDSDDLIPWPMTFQRWLYNSEWYITCCTLYGTK